MQLPRRDSRPPLGVCDRAWELGLLGLLEIISTAQCFGILLALGTKECGIKV